MLIIFSSLWSYFKFKSNLKICRFKRYKIRLYDPWYSNLISKIVFIMSGRNMIWLEKRYEYFTPPDVFSSSFLIIHKSIYLIYIKLHTHIYINTIEISEKILTNLFNIRFPYYLKLHSIFFPKIWQLFANRERGNGLNVVGGRVTGVVFVKTGWKWLDETELVPVVLDYVSYARAAVHRHCSRDIAAALFGINNWWIESGSRCRATWWNTRQKLPGNAEAKYIERPYIQ